MAGRSRRWGVYLEIWLYARLLPLRILGKDFAGILAFADRGEMASGPALPVEVITGYVRKAVRHPWVMRDRRCLRAGLVGYSFLRRYGHDPELHFAIDSETTGMDRLSAHCWVSVDGEEVIERRDTNQVTIHVHKASGTGKPGEGAR